MSVTGTPRVSNEALKQQQLQCHFDTLSALVVDRICHMFCAVTQQPLTL